MYTATTTARAWSTAPACSRSGGCDARVHIDHVGIGHAGPDLMLQHATIFGSNVVADYDHDTP